MNCRFLSNQMDCRIFLGSVAKRVASPAVRRAMVAIALMLCASLGAQEPTFNAKGENLAGVAIGFGGYYSGSMYVGNGISRLPFISLYYENCVKDNLFNEKSSLGIGGMLGYTSITAKDFFKSSYTVLGARGVLHYALVDKLDTYAGVMLGYEIASWKWIGSWSTIGGKGDAESAFDAGLFVGARYYFNEKAAAFAEAGFGAANLNIGLSIKF